MVSDDELLRPVIGETWKNEVARSEKRTGVRSRLRKKDGSFAIRFLLYPDPVFNTNKSKPFFSAQNGKMPVFAVLRRLQNDHNGILMIMTVFQKLERCSGSWNGAPEARTVFWKLERCPGS